MSEPRFRPTVFTPTDEQRAIQCSAERRILVEAAAGAAKTSTLALRIAERLAQGGSPQRILALTFTETATVALRERLTQLGLGAELLHSLRIHSVEDYASRVLRHLEVQQGRDPVRWLRSPEQLRPYLWDAIEQLSLNPQERHREELTLPAFHSDSAIAAYLQQFQRIKGQMLLQLQPADGPDDPDYAWSLGLDYTLLRVLRHYEALRWSAGDAHPLFRGPHDASHDLARLLLSEDEPVPLDWLLGRYDELLVDEMHDCNAAMFTLLQVFMRDAKLSLCAVGDRDQVIHRQHGADAAYMGAAFDQAAGAKVWRPRLSASYRFGNSLARWMGRLTDKPIRAASATPDRPALQTTIARLDYRDDADCEAQLLQALRDWRRERGSDKAWAEAAVLLRRESQSVRLENLLHREGIAYRCQGFESYLRRPEVLFIRALQAVGSQRWDLLGGAATRRLMPAALFEMTQTPARRDDDPEYRNDEDYLRAAAQHAADNALVIGELLHNNLLQQCKPAMRRRLQAALAVAASHGPFDAMLDALELPAIAREVFIEAPRRQELLRHVEGLKAAAQGQGIDEFFRQLQQQDLAYEQRQAARAAGRQYGVKEARYLLTLASVEQVKGLEYPHVLMPWLRQGLFPETQQRLADERNLFYVGATRARQRLSLLADATAPSEFLAGL